MIDEEVKMRLSKVEDEHSEFKQLLRDFSKDFHLLTTSFHEVKDVLKVLSQSQTDLNLHRQEFQSHIALEVLQNKTQDDRIKKVEDNQNKVIWTILSSVILAILGLVLKGSIS